MKTAQRKLQRYEDKKDQSANTPKSKTDKLIKQSGLIPETVPEIRKKLLFGECLASEITVAKCAQESKSKLKEVVHRVASGRIIKKYRLKQLLEKKTTLNRRKSMLSKSVTAERKRRLENLQKHVNEEVEQFLNRDSKQR